MSLSGKTLFISGASRGIGLAIALRAARDGANVALIAKTAEPHPKLEGTVYTAAEQIEAAGGKALPIVGDIRDEAQVERGGRAGRRALRRHRRVREQRLGDQPVRHRGPRHEALRPHAGHQRPRHVRRDARLRPAPAEGREPAHPHALPADRDRGPLARAARRVHARQVRDEPLRARLRRRVPGRRHRVQRAVAAHADRDRRGAEPARRRGGDGEVAQARAVRRRRLRGHHPARAASAPATPTSARTCSPRRA